jgi:uncharacterized protein with beta-barrel porin domain
MAEIDGGTGSLSATTTVGHGDGKTCNGPSVWAQTLASVDRISGGGLVASNSGSGLVAGADRRWARGDALGVAFGYQDNLLTVDALTSRATGDTYFVSLYGRRVAGPFWLDGQVFYAKSLWSQNRTIAGYGVANSKPTGDAAGSLVQVSLPLHGGGLRPYARIGVAFDRGGSVETGVGALGLSTQSNANASTWGEAGLLYVGAMSKSVSPEVRIGVEQDFTGRERKVELGLAAIGGTSLTTDAIVPAATSGVVDAALNLHMSGRFRLISEIRGRFSSDQADAAATFGGVLQF